MKICKYCALSDADLLYYDAVMLRCSYKLLQATIS